MSKTSTVLLKAASVREEESVRKVLAELLNLPDETLKQHLNLDNVEVIDVKDVIRRSGIY